MPEASEPPERPVAPPVREAVQRWRLVLEREPLGPDAGQRERLAAWDEALRASGLPIAGLDADPPRPRFAIAAPLGATLRGSAELVDVWLVERVPAWRAREAIDGSLPAGHTLRDIFDVWLGEAALPGQVVASVYRVRLDGLPAGEVAGLERACRVLIEAPTIERERMKGTGPVRYDLRPFIETLDVEAAAGDAPVVRMTLRHDPERGVGRPDEVLAALASAWGRDDALRVDAIVRERLVLAPPVPVVAARPRGPRRGAQAMAPASRPRK